MDKWDQAKLDRVVLSKHGNTKSTTDKVCKFFLQAVEEGKYGWFWSVARAWPHVQAMLTAPPGQGVPEWRRRLLLQASVSGDAQ